MASSIESYVGHTVSVITADGRNIVGTLKGYDQTINIILDESHERVYSQNAGVEQVISFVIWKFTKKYMVWQVDADHGELFCKK